MSHGEWLLWFVGVAALVVGPKLLDRWMWAGTAERTFREFMRAFPGKCPVCSFHRYGLQYGYEEPGSMPAPHACPETNSLTAKKP